MATLAARNACAGMAATLAAIQFTGTAARIVSVGDSRVYRFRDGQLTQLTVDHTLARRMVASGDLTAEQASQAGSLYQDLDSALIASESESAFDLHYGVSETQPGDTWLVCTDGITQALTDIELAALTRGRQPSPPGRRARAILDAALSVRDSDDNLSVIFVDVRAAGSDVVRVA